MLEIIVGIFIKFPYVFYTFLIAIFIYFFMNLVTNSYAKMKKKNEERKQLIQFKEKPFLKYKSYISNSLCSSNRLDKNSNYSTLRFGSKNINYEKEKIDFNFKSLELIKIIESADDLNEEERNILIRSINTENSVYAQWLSNKKNEKDEAINALVNAQLKIEELRKQNFLRKRKLIEKLVAPYSHIQIDFGSANYPYLSKSNKICVKSNIYEYKKLDKYLYVTADGESYDIAVVNLYRQLSEYRKKGNLRRIDRNNDAESV